MATGFFPSKEQREVIDSLPKTTWVEWEVPEELEDKINSFIEDSLKEYYDKNK
jgi:formylmethanofuran dehydrogenase subunit A